MKKVMPMPRVGRPPQDPAGSITDGGWKSVWMTDLKKAGERAEYLGPKNQKNGVQTGWRKRKWINRLWLALAQ
jgi:hypothetical protein